MSFRNWLLNESSESRKTHLAIFDFDKTLAHTPDKPQDWTPTPIPGKKTSKDWYTHPESMSMPHYGGQFNEPIVRAFLAAKRDPSTHAAMLTGRVGMRTAPVIRSHLHKQGLYGNRVIGPAHVKSQTRADAEDPQHSRQHHDDSHEEYYKGDFRHEPDYPKNEKGIPLGDTLDHKIYVVKRLMHDGIEVLDFYDDREKHRSRFLMEFSELMKVWDNLQTIRLHAIFPDHIDEHTLSRGNPEWSRRQVPLHGKVVLPEVPSPELTESRYEGLIHVKPGEIGPGIRDNEAVKEYEEKILRFRKVMPIEITSEGEIVDGEHRYKAMINLKVPRIPAFVGDQMGSTGRLVKPYSGISVDVEVPEVPPTE